MPSVLAASLSNTNSEWALGPFAKNEEPIM